MKKNVPIEKSTENVEIFDTGIAIMAGLMIIPAVFAFSGGSTENLKAGPSLIGTDVLFFVYRNGNSGNLRLIYVKERTN